MAASVQIPVTQTGLEASIQAALRNAGKGAQINLGTNSRQINALAQPLGRITGQADEFTKSMEAANARVFAFGASVGIINGVTSAFSSLVKSTIAVEKSLTEINSVFQKSSSELEKFGNSLFDVAKNTGQSFDAVAKGALELARQGLSTEESLRRINDALILTRLSGLDAERSVSGLTAAVNAFKSTGITTSEVLNKLVVVSQKYSVSEKDLIEGLKRSSSVAKQAGVSFDELVGIITAVQEKTSVGGAVIGNSFKTIFTRLQRTDTLDALQQLGVSVTDVQGRILPATKLLENLAGTIKSLNQVQLAEITEKVGGGFQIDKLLATLEDLSSQSSVAFKATEISLKSTNQAYEKNAALNVTLAALINKTSLSAEQLGATLGKIGITDSAKSLLGFFNGLLEGIQKILGEESALGDVFRGLAKGIGNLVTGPGLALFAAIILKLSKDLAQFGFASLKGFFGIGKAAKEIQNVEQSIASALSRNVGLQRQLFALEGNRAAQIKLMSDAIVLQEAAMRRMASTANTLAAPLYGQGVRSTGEGLRVPKAAGGYMPAVSQESSDIRKGVGGARSGDRPVVIPNFNFGQGKKGSIVAHTGEYAVPNFAGSGGTAIFNRDMVRSMGLPSGAKKIGASGGLIPNFANVTQANNIVKFNNYPVQEVISKKGSLQQINKVDTIDQFSGKVEIIEQKRNNNEYNKATNKLIDQFWGKENKDGNNEKLNRILSSMGRKGIDQQYLTRIRTSYGKRDHSTLRKQFKGALGELDAKKLSGQQLASDNAYMDLVGGGEIKTTIATPFSGIASKIMNDYLSSGPNLRNFTKDGKPKLDKVNAQKLPLYMPVGGKVSLNSAKGFIPNFADLADTIRQYYPDLESYRKEPGGKKFVFPNGVETYQSNIDNVLKRNPSFATQKKASDQKKLDQGFLNFNIDANTLGGIALVTPKEGDSSGYVSAKLKGSELKDNKPRGLLDDDQIILSNIQQTGVPTKKNFEQISSEINKFFAGPIVALAQSLYGRLYSGMQAGEFTDQLGNLKSTSKGGILPAGAEGQLFEAASKAALTTMKDLSASFDPKNENRPFDFTNPAAMNQMLGVKAVRGDAKRGGGSAANFQGQVNTLVKKSMNDGDIAPKILSQISQQSKGRKSPNAAGGFIPNFAQTSNQIGSSGAQGGFYDLQNRFGNSRKYLGIKKFDENLPISALKNPIAREWLSAKYLKNRTMGKMVTGPKIVSGLAESIKNKSIVKEIIKDPLATNLVGGNQAGIFGTSTLRNYLLQKTGLDIPDLHGRNYTANNAAKPYLLGQKALSDYSTDGAKINIIDTGLANAKPETMQEFQKLINQAGQKAQNAKSAAGGFLPNFANPLKDAIGREMAAGVPASQIYVDKNPSLKSVGNPMGLMVANRRDEPAGGYQGINRAIKEGRNPKTYGAASGFVPNYVAGATTGPDLTPFVGKTVPQAQDKIAKDLNDTLDRLNDEYRKQLSNLKETTKNIEEKLKIEKDLVKVQRDELAKYIKAIRQSSRQGGDALKILEAQQQAKNKKSEIVATNQSIINNQSKLDRIQSGEALKNLATNRKNQEAQAKKDASEMSSAVAANAKRGLGNPITPRVVDPNVPKKSGVDIGTVFALQGAMTVLTGATDGATSKMGLFSNSLASTLSNVTAISFGFQALKNLAPEGTKAANVLGKLGGVGMIAYAGFEGMKLLFKSFKIWNGDIERSAVAIASFNDKLNGFLLLEGTKPQTEEEKVKSAKETEKLIKNAEYDIYNKNLTGGFGTQMDIAASALGAATPDFIGKEAMMGFSKSSISAVGAVSDMTSGNRLTSDKEFTSLIENIRKTKLIDDKTLQALISNIKESSGNNAEEVKQFFADFAKNQISLSNSIFPKIQKRANLPESYSLNVKEKKLPIEKQRELINANDESYVKSIVGEDEVLIKAAMAYLKATREFNSAKKDQQSREELSSIPMVDLEKTKTQLNNTIELAVQRERINDVLDKELKSSQILGNYSQKQIDDLEYRIQLRDNERELADQTKGFIQEQINKLKDLGVAEKVRNELNKELSGLNTEQLTDQNAIKEIVKKINAELGINGDYNDAQRENNEVILQGYFDQNEAKKKGLELSKDELNKLKEQATTLKDIISSAQRASQQRSFSIDMTSRRSQFSNTQKITELQASKLGRSPDEIKRIDANTAEIEANTVALENIAKYNKMLEDKRGELLGLAKFQNKEQASIFEGRLIGSKDIKDLERNAEMAMKMEGIDPDAIEVLKKFIQDLKKESASLQLDAESAQAAASAREREAKAIEPVISALEMFKRSLLGTNIIDQKIQDLELEKLTSISGRRNAEIDYEIGTLNQQKGQSEEEAARIARKRQAKTIPQLFGEEYSKTMEERTLEFNKTIVDASIQFKNNLIDGISKAIEEGGTLADILKGGALDFVRTLNKQLMSNMFNSLLGSNKNGSSGLLGSIFGYASGGPITGGSGAKDDVPAMLMGGEYVINKKSVGRYGPKFLEAINNGTLGGYAQGGKVQSGKGGFFTPGTYGLGGIQGTGNLLKFATQGYTSGARDQIVNQGNYASINLEAESARLTNFGRSNSPQAEATRSAKEQAFGLYVQEIQAQQEAQKQAEAEKDAFKKQLIMLGVTAVGSYVGGIAKTGFQQGVAGAAEKATTWQKFTAGLSGVGEKFGNVGSGISSLFSGNMQQAGDYFSMARTNLASGVLKGNVVDEVVKQVSNGGYKSSATNSGYGFDSGSSIGLPPVDLPIADFSIGETSLSSLAQKELMNRNLAFQLAREKFEQDPRFYGSPFLLDKLASDQVKKLSETSSINSYILGQGGKPYATGGSISSRGGIDTVPAMLSGGEFIMNRSAAQNIGAGNLQALNAGAGTIVTEEKTEELNEKLIAKLDELIEASGGASSITINVEGSTGAATQSTNGNPTDQRQQMARQIKDAVLKILQDEKRLGGQLRR